MSCTWKTKVKPLDRVKYVGPYEPDRGKTARIVQIEIQKYESEKKEKYAISYTLLWDGFEFGDQNGIVRFMESVLQSVS